ncbi:hypothetical protein JVT61DRAFT_3846 [Boletus reticuloceps]|uniref:Uncharacterized protein n=1 Tax=Boletus reticuloceps TaxID=495285 RepID=A0A8I2YP62_9AGAM|nr:hypothetical protein JVT61DRAFT_3846 [Boletus reticuloceps]
MSFGARRLHRLPQRLDYNLIPAPLDLLLPQAAEKSPLPAIIVTPSSPSLSAPEYYIAFLTPPPKPSLRERITQSFPFKARTTLFISLLLFILACHFLAYLAVHRPHFDFKSSGIATHSDSFATSAWNLVPFDFQALWDTAANGDSRNYIVEELSQAAHR